MAFEIYFVAISNVRKFISLSYVHNFWQNTKKKAVVFMLCFAIAIAILR